MQYELIEYFSYCVFIVSILTHLCPVNSSTTKKKLFGPVRFQLQGVWLVCIITMS